MTFKMAKRRIDVLRSANKNCSVFERMLEDDAITKIMLFKGSGDDLTPSYSSSSESETKWLCEKCGVHLHPGMCDMKYYIAITVSLCPMKSSFKSLH
jgi:hypothetical protein